MKSWHNYLIFVYRWSLQWLLIRISLTKSVYCERLNAKVSLCLHCILNKFGILHLWLHVTWDLNRPGSYLRMDWLHLSKGHIIKIIEIKPLLMMCFEFHDITAFLHFSVQREMKIILQSVNKSKCNSACNDTEIIFEYHFSRREKKHENFILNRSICWDQEWKVVCFSSHWPVL